MEENVVISPLERQTLDTRLTALYRKAKSDLAEGGANTLFLAIGFLRWRPVGEKNRFYLAPLLLTPVKLSRRSPSSPFYLERHEDDVRFNATLTQLLKQDFHCDLTHLENNLPTDDCGVDVRQLFSRVREAVRDIPGCEVVEDAAIASFSFAKYLMWKDLNDRRDLLGRNRLVGHMIHSQDQPFPESGGSSMPRENELDSRYSPSDLVHPLPADSSQLAAIMAAAEGHDLVIKGPPGTGKSQTIANLISQCLAIGKTVLFVAEKAAALDVVHRRLQQHGLGECCVELHSNKAERRRFLDQLERSWAGRSESHESDWLEVNDRLKIRRDELIAYAKALHEVDSNGWTAYRAMGEILKGRQIVAPPLIWPKGTRHDQAAYRELETVVSDLSVRHSALTSPPAERLQATDWSVDWQTRFLDTCQRLVKASDAVATAMKSLFGELGETVPTAISTEKFQSLGLLARHCQSPKLPPVEILAHGDLDRLQSVLDRRAEILETRKLADATFDKALERFCGVFGESPQGGIPASRRSALFRLADEIVRQGEAVVALALHPQFAELATLLAERSKLWEVRANARSSLEARGFIPSLIERKGVGEIEREWKQARSSFWPLSAWRTNQLRRKLRGRMVAGAAPEPDVDVPLLNEYRVADSRLADNLEALGLPPPARAAVESRPDALSNQMTQAASVRSAVRDAGFAWLDAAVPSPASVRDILEAARSLGAPHFQLAEVERLADENLAEVDLPLAWKEPLRNDATAAAAQIRTSFEIRQTLRLCGVAPDRSQNVIQSLLAMPIGRRQDQGKALGLAALEFSVGWKDYKKLAEVVPADGKSSDVLGDAAKQGRHVLSNSASLKSWLSWIGVRKRAERVGLASFVTVLTAREVSATELSERFRLAYARWWLPIRVDQREPLRRFEFALHENAVREFRQLEDLARGHASAQVLRALPTIPRENIPPKSELGLLRHQIRLQRPSRSIRDLIGAMPNEFPKLAPCLLMSPLSIAQYLPSDLKPFDVVVFDEASQIATWDAIGAIARGTQTIIVGDPKQLPPTNFFARADAEDEEPGEEERDQESILDEVIALGLPTRQLNWHYRSRHESLITFSNWHYYDRKLVTFPAADATDCGVSLKHVEHAKYVGGASRTNRREAEAIVADTVARMRKWLELPEERRPTLGIVTFNLQQQELIQDLLDKEQRERPELEWFFSDDRIEPAIVKNLENIQGDERDVMMFSITFGKDDTGKFSMNFGALNRDGGHRRLNVAITRARQELVVYTSFRPDEIRIERTKAQGVRDLKAFLEYAEKGPQAILARTEGTSGGYESPFEDSVAEALVERGWRVEPQIGVSGYRIDLGIIHPDKPGAYLAGIECDGATYHRSAMARDRDKLRQQVLESLGWVIKRVWSTDWWYARDAALDRLDQDLRDVLELSRKRGTPEKTDYVPGNEAATRPELLAIVPAACTEPPRADESIVPYATRESPHSSESLVAHLAIPTTVRESDKSRPRYQRCRLDDATACQDRLFDEAYSATLREMAIKVLRIEGPMRDQSLAREVAQAHGFARTSSRIVDRVMAVISDFCTTNEPSVGTFVWPESVADVVPFRFPADGEDRRKLDEIAMPELIGLVRRYPDLRQEDDPAIWLAREIGLARLARRARERLEAAIEAAGS